jgi:thiol-disulfide isomerase/thioredoxin
MKKIIITLGAVLAFAGAYAAELGMPAPALSVAEWVKGKAVNLNEGKGKTIYVVEFWATWCPPCRASIPHLTELQKKFKDKGVTVIGVSDETVSTVKPFVNKMGNKMEYTVAVDKGQKTSAAYMGAFGVDGIPHAFVVDKTGAIAWHGHPMGGLDKAIEDVLAGKKPGKP